MRVGIVDFVIAALGLNFIFFIFLFESTSFKTHLSNGKDYDSIIPGLMGIDGSSLSETPDWSLLYVICWTTGSETWKSRHDIMLESIFLHNPNAIVIVLSPTLQQDFFMELYQQGYRLFVLPLSKETLLEYKWYIGENTENWIRNWGKWEEGKFFYSHLTDYIRFIFLYKYGGTYMDADAIWLHSPPPVEFIGSDISDGYAEWFLNDKGKYLAPGVMRFKKGKKLLMEVAEETFSPNYNPQCFNCVGPKAITQKVKQIGEENVDFEMLSPHLLYPYNYLEIADHAFNRAHSIKTLLLMDSSWSLHLFGHMTKNKEAEIGSIVDDYKTHFSLDLSYNHRHQAHSQKFPLTLRAPVIYIDSKKNENSFIKFNIIRIKGGLKSDGINEIEIGVKAKYGTLSWLDEKFQESLSLKVSSNRRYINYIFSTLRYKAPKVIPDQGAHDRIDVFVSQVETVKVLEKEQRVTVHAAFPVWVYEHSFTVIMYSDCIKHENIPNNIKVLLIVLCVDEDESQHRIEHENDKLTVAYSHPSYLPKIKGGLELLQTDNFLYWKSSIPFNESGLEVIASVFLREDSDVVAPISADKNKKPNAHGLFSNRQLIMNSARMGRGLCHSVEYTPEVFFASRSKLSFIDWEDAKVLGSTEFFLQLKDNGITVSACENGLSKTEIFQVSESDQLAEQFRNIL